jgi:choline-sulfatase
VNVLVVMSDQHNPKVMGCAGHPVVATPNLDALAAAGVRSTAAYTNSPICVPARAAWATGHYVHEIGYWDNAIAYDGRAPGWGHALQRAGIPVESIGKLHYVDADAPTGFDRQIDPMHIMGGIGQVWGSVRDPLPRKVGAPFLVTRSGALRSSGPRSRKNGDVATGRVRLDACCNSPVRDGPASRIVQAPVEPANHSRGGRDR